MSKPEKDIIQLKSDVNKIDDEIHKEQNNVENLPIENINNDEVIHHSLEIEQEAKTEVIENDEQKDHKELSFDEIVSKILTKEIKTNKDFGRVIEGRWTFKRGKTDRDLIPAIKAGKTNDSEYDQELVKKNITKLLKKVN